MIDKFGLLKGMLLYLKIKMNRLHAIKIAGISQPFSLRKNNADTAVFEQVFLQDGYNINIFFEPLVIVDAGANIGLFTILMKNRFPAAKIICIEPDADNCEALKKNLAAYSGITVINAGLWRSDTKLKMVDNYNLKSAMMVEEDEQHGQTQGITIDTLMRNHLIDRIDILKLDIETSEQELFLTNYAQWLPKTKMIIIELHDWMKPGCSKPFFEAVNKTFSKYSYAVCGENTVIENMDLP